MKKLLITFSFILMCSCFGDVETFVRVDSLNQLYGTWVRNDNQLIDNESVILIDKEKNVIMLRDGVPLRLRSRIPLLALVPVILSL